MIHAIHNLFSIYCVKRSLDQRRRGLVPIIHELFELHFFVVPLHHAENIFYCVQFRLIRCVEYHLELKFLELRLNFFGFVHDEVVHEQCHSSERISLAQSNQGLAELFSVHAPLELHR